jgi:hypothetical protein
MKDPRAGLQHDHEAQRDDRGEASRAGQGPELEVQGGNDRARHGDHGADRVAFTADVGEQLGTGGLSLGPPPSLLVLELAVDAALVLAYVAPVGAGLGTVGRLVPAALTGAAPEAGSAVPGRACPCRRPCGTGAR